MVIVVMAPDADRFAPLAFGVKGVTVETFLGADPIVELRFPVVPRVDERSIGAVKFPSSWYGRRSWPVVGAFVGDQPDQSVEPLSSEIWSCTREEADGGADSYDHSRDRGGQGPDPISPQAGEQQVAGGGVLRGAAHVFTEVHGGSE